MTGQQIVEEIQSKRGPKDQFIRWWRHENDFVDYELIDRFEDNIEKGQEFDGYQLLDTESMWDLLQKRLPERVSRKKEGAGEMIYWKRPEKGDQTCPFSPESIMTIFDVETRGNVIEP